MCGAPVKKSLFYHTGHPPKPKPRPSLQKRASEKLQAGAGGGAKSLSSVAKMVNGDVGRVVKSKACSLM